MSNPQGPPPPASPNPPPGGSPPASGYPPGATGVPKKKGLSTGCIVAIIVVPLVLLFFGGIIAAITIPAFLKYTKRSKTSEAAINIKAIADGAISWYDKEHYTSGGSPMPKHFPGKYSPTRIAPSRTTTPTARPCANGKPLYPKNSAQWEVAPWRQLKFGINRPHYYRYTYFQTGSGTKAKFLILANSDLDCDRNLSTFMSRGNVSSATGEVLRSGLVIRNRLE